MTNIGHFFLTKFIIIFINLYGKDKKSKYRTKSTEFAIEVNNYKFYDFEIERREQGWKY